MSASSQPSADTLDQLHAGERPATEATSYRRWSEAVRQYPAAHPEERGLWQAALDEFARCGDQPLRKLVLGEETVTESRFELDQRLTGRLLTETNHVYRTQINNVLLTALAHALHDLVGERENHIVVEGHGREDIDPALDVSRTVGWFTTIFPVRLTAAEDHRTTLRTVKETLRSIPAKGLGYGAFFGYDRNVLPRVNFNYLGRFERQDSGWRITRETPGIALHQDNADNNIITINGMVLDGRLTFHFASKLSQDSADLLADRFRQHLTDLVVELSGLRRGYLTPSDVDGIVTQEYLDEIQQDREVVGVYLANSLQQGFVHHAVTQGRSDDAYIVQMCWSYRTAIDPVILHEAWRRTQRTFAALRLRFYWQRELVQVIDAEATVDWRPLDLSGQAAAEQEESLRRLLQSDRAESYNLAAGALFRVYLVNCGPALTTCVFSSHHAILDGWSSTILLDHLHQLYQDLVAGRPPTPVEDRYALVQRHLQEHRLDHTVFWRDTLARYEARMDLQGLLSVEARRAGVQVDAVWRSRSMRELQFPVAGEQFRLLRALGREHGITPNALLLYLWHQVLGLYSGSSQTICGVVVSGRGIPVGGVDRVVGLLINTLPMVLEPGGAGVSVVAGVRDVQRQINDLTAHSTVDLSSLHQGGGRLFDSLFIYENWPRGDGQGWQAQFQVSFEGQFEKVNYPLSVVLTDTPDGLDFRLNYAEDVFDGGIVEQMLHTQRHLLAEALQRIDEPFANLGLLSADQLHGIARDLAGPVATEAADLPFHRRFERQARHSPEQVAVAAGGQTLTYRALNDRANRLADVLRGRHGVRPEEPVLLCLDRGVELVVALLAVMKAGSAYVPLDPGQSPERMRHVLSDTGARVVLCADRHRAWLETFPGLTVLALDAADLADSLAAAAAADPPELVDSSALAYVIYTSGTTGLPKGVMIEHRAFCRLLDAVRAGYFADRATVSTYSLTNQIFDIFGLEYGLPLLTGGTVTLATELPEQLDCVGLGFVQATPSVGDLLLERLTNTDGTLLFLGGEKLGEDLLDRVQGRGIDVVNMYGPTETTIWSTSRRYRPGDERAGRVVGLGRPFEGESVHILDGGFRPVPPGSVGELFIGGVGLARGYWNNAQLTAERFVMSAGERLYRTGDLVRLRPGGELEFIGRNDFQVKIRGHRIELAEVQSAILGYPGVRQCVVVVRDTNAGKALAGYYVADGGLGQRELADHLRGALPSYMVPAALVRLPAIPLTISGKIDRRALPDPEMSSGHRHVHPRNSMDTDVRRIMADVLGLSADSVGIDDDFFELGGDSILSIKLITSLHRELRLSLSAGYLLATRTIRQFVDNLAGGTRRVQTIEPVPAAAAQQLSFAQERLWFIEQFEEGSNAYNLPLVLSVAPRVEPDLMARSVRELFRHHEVLRSLIRQRPDGTGYQAVQDMAAVPELIETVEVPDRAAMHEDLRQQLRGVFDLAHQLPVRVRLYQVGGPHERYLLFVIHHVAFDGWSTDVLLRNLCRYYRLAEQAAPGTDPFASVPAATLQYRDFAAWQRRQLTGERVEDLLRFWRDRLDGVETLSLITDHPRPETLDYRGAALGFEADEELSGRLRQLARQLKVSLFSLLLSGYYLTLRCFTNQDDLVIGTPFANRDHPQLEQLIGFFVNTLPLRSRIDPTMTVADYVTATASEVLRALDHQELPFERLVEGLNVVRDLSRHPIFQVAFGVQSFGAPPRGAGQSAAEPFAATADTTELYDVSRFDIGTFVDDSGDRLKIFINYAVGLFDARTIGSVGETYLHVLRQLSGLLHAGAAADTVRIGDLTYLDEGRYDEIVNGRSAPRARYDGDALLHRLFEQQAARRPNDVAVVWKGRQLTYQGLNEASSQLAHHLLGLRRLGPDRLVLLCLDRSDYLMLSILGVLKAGAGYVPVDPSYPDDRIAFMLQDTQARVVLTNRRHADRLTAIVAGGEPGAAPAADPPVVLAVDAPQLLDEISAEPSQAPEVDVDSRALAYVLYTSGTTGRPKGVPQSHANVVRLFRACEEVYDIRSDDVWTLFHSYVFDFTVWEMWGALLYGGRLVVPTTEETRDPRLFYALCRRERVTVLSQTPTAFFQLMDVAMGKDERQGLDDLRYVIFGGEALNVPLLQPWYERYPDRPLLAAGYGTTETTVFTCAKFYDRHDRSSTDIGLLLPDVAGYVLNTQLRPLPVGAVGELFIGGEGLAEEYLNRPELTAERFLDNPFQSEDERRDVSTSPLGRNARLYRSGDLVRWAPDGHLEFVRRNDFQVKIRGHRVELGEVEAVIAAITGIRQCAVVARQSVGGNVLAAYYASDQTLDLEDLYKHVRAKLPEYMVPSAFVRLAELPRTISGKLDVRALPEPEPVGSDEAVPPSTELEVRARDLMADVLDVPRERVGLRDDFFQLGGNSILSIKFVGQLSRALGTDVSIGALFRHRTIGELLQHLDLSEPGVEVIPRLATGDVTAQVLSSAQERLWFIDRFEPGSHVYNIYLLYDILAGTDLDALERGIQAVFDRHDVLRTVFREDAEGTPYQVVVEQNLTVERVAVHDRQEVHARVRKALETPFDLTAECPFRVVFYLPGDGYDGPASVGFFVHHIAFDGWSADLLLQELGAFYRAFTQPAGSDAAANLPALSISYRDYAAWQRGRLERGRLAELREFWHEALSGEPAQDLVTDRPRPLRFGHRAAFLTVDLDAELSAALRRLARELNVTLFSVLLSGWYLMLSAYSGRDRFVVGVPAFNRQHPQTQDLIGCFVNSLPLSFRCEPADDAATMIRKVAERIIAAQQHQDMPFQQLVAELGGRRDPGRHPLFNVWFDVHSFAQTAADHDGRGTAAAPLRTHSLNDLAANPKQETVTRFDLSGEINDGGDVLVGTFTYAVSLFDRATVERFIGTYLSILREFTDDPSSGRALRHLRNAGTSEGTPR